MAPAEFSKFAGILSAAFSQHHLVRFEIAQLEARDVVSIPRSGRSPGGGNDNPLQYSCLESSMDRGVWWLQYMVSQSQT